MIPLNLSLSGFLSYRTPVEIDFTNFDLACISGANGAGKSSLLDAITFALFGQARKRDDALINTYSEMAEVIFSFAYEGNNYKVQRSKTRGKSSLLEFHIQGQDGKWKSLTERTMRDTDARIQETLRLDYETFVNASFFLQGKADQFTQQKPADRKRILSSILGLEIWDSYRASTAEQRRSLEAELNAIDGRMQEISAELQEEGERKKVLASLTDELERLKLSRSAQESSLKDFRLRASANQQQAQLVNSLAEQLDRQQSTLSELSQRLEERIAESNQFSEIIAQKQSLTKSHADWLASKEKLRQIDNIAENFRNEEKNRSAPLLIIQAEKAKLETEIKNLLGQEAKFQQHIQRSTQISELLLAANKQVADGQSQLSRKADLESQLENGRATLAKVSAENPHLKNEMDGLKARIDQIKKAKGATCPTCGQTLTEEHRQEMVSLWTEEGSQHGDRYRANQLALKEARKAVQASEKLMSQLALDENQLRDSTRSADQLITERDDLKQKISAWEKEGAPSLKRFKSMLEKGDFAPEAHKQLAGIDAQLKKIGYDAAHHDSLKKLLQEQQKVDDDFRLLEKAEAAAKPLEREISQIETQIKDGQKELALNEKSHSEAAANLALLEIDLPDIQKLEKQAQELLQSENNLRQELGAAKQRVAVLDELRRRKKDLEEQRESIALQIGHYLSLERAFGKDGVPAMLIEQALPQIEISANEILERLSGGQMHISFITQQAYKDKKRDDLRETLDIQISDSAGIRDYEMFSGGEAFRINFAIRLALSEVLAQRAGARLQTLVIDEGFGSQDEIGRQRLIEAINLVKEDFKMILVITHIDSLKEAFPTRIEVEKTSMGSSITIN